MNATDTIAALSEEAQKWADDHGVVWFDGDTKLIEAINAVLARSADLEALVQAAEAIVKREGMKGSPDDYEYALAAAVARVEGGSDG